MQTICTKKPKIWQAEKCDYTQDVWATWTSIDGRRRCENEMELIHKKFIYGERAELTEESNLDSIF